MMDETQLQQETKHYGEALQAERSKNVVLMAENRCLRQALQAANEALEAMEEVRDE